jgi:hypothetical protein
MPVSSSSVMKVVPGRTWSLPHENEAGHANSSLIGQIEKIGGCRDAPAFQLVPHQAYRVGLER